MRTLALAWAAGRGFLTLLSRPPPPPLTHFFDTQHAVPAWAEQARALAALGEDHKIECVKWYSKGDKWQVGLSYEGQTMHIGRFDEREEAIAWSLYARAERNEGRCPASAPKPVKREEPPNVGIAGADAAELEAPTEEHWRVARELAAKGERVRHVSYNPRSGKSHVLLKCGSEAVTVGTFKDHTAAIAWSLLAHEQRAVGKRPTRAPLKDDIPVPWARGKSRQALAAHARELAEQGARVVGVFWKKDKEKYQAQISYKGADVNLGKFESRVDAIVARLKAEVEKYEGRRPNPAPVKPKAKPIGVGMSAQELGEYAKRKVEQGAEVVGVSWHKTAGRWKVSIGYEGAVLNLGFFDYADKAIVARLRAEVDKYEGRRPDDAGELRAAEVLMGFSGFIEAAAATPMTTTARKGKGKRAKDAGNRRAKANKRQKGDA